jgi:hypothetical protein
MDIIKLFLYYYLVGKYKKYFCKLKTDMKAGFRKAFMGCFPAMQIDLIFTKNELTCILHLSCNLKKINKLTQMIFLNVNSSP